MCVPALAYSSRAAGQRLRNSRCSINRRERSVELHRAGIQNIQLNSLDLGRPPQKCDLPLGDLSHVRIAEKCEDLALGKGLAEIGFAGEGRDVVIDYRFAEGNYDRLSMFAAELVSRHVDVMAASGMPAAVIAKSIRRRDGPPRIVGRPSSPTRPTT